MTKNRTYLLNDKGSFAIIFAITLPILIVIIGVAVDMSRYNIIKSKFNGALDGAVLAASTVVETQDAELVANNFFKANFPEKYMNTLTLPDVGKSGPVKITVKKIKEDGNNKLSVKGEVKADVSFMFSNAFGLTASRITHVSKVERIVDPNVEIVLTVDVSPSMCTTSVRSADNPVNLTPDSDCKKLKAMKKAMKKSTTTVGISIRRSVKV
jgi:Flp pilus assembly protein TadG